MKGYWFFRLLFWALIAVAVFAIIEGWAHKNDYEEASSASPTPAYGQYDDTEGGADANALGCPVVITPAMLCHMSYSTIYACTKAGSKVENGNSDCSGG